MAAYGLPRSGFLSTGDVRLHYVDWGGPDERRLLLLHGLSANARVWDDFARAALSATRVVALDQRGHGDSGWSPAGAYGAFDFAADLGRLLDHLGWPDADIVGSSMGGRNALAVAAAFPERVSRLVVVDIGPGRREVDAPPLPATPTQDREETPRTFASLEEGAQWMHAAYPSRSLDLCRARIRHNTRMRTDGRLGWKWDPSLYQGFRAAESLWPLLPAIACPVLLLRGEQSNVLSRAAAEETRAALKACTLIEIPGVGHNITTDRPEAFRAAVGPFLGLGVGNAAGG